MKTVSKENLSKGYYGVFFADGKTMFIAKLSKERSGSFRSLFVSKETIADIVLEFENENDCTANVEIRYGYDSNEGAKSLAFVGKCAFVENVLVLPSLNNNICFVIYNLN